ncbi:FAM81A-like isoform X1 [Brachionus plicatilis]|uniref:FAM81A-like isoform X1 n=1 Tax=Brachionus plicatilis TaxID=10195 RepID=A0A3M7PUI5_BRAPC|nr:FAM81A-like isoform X1 [Brachionus plicatilis]
MSNFTPRRDTTPRLPPIIQPITLNEPLNIPPDRMSEFLSDERRARLVLDEQIRVISSVCKKLNSDIEALDGQLAERAFQMNNVEFKTNDFQANFLAINKDLQFKITRHDNQLNRIENDMMVHSNSLKELQFQYQDNNRSAQLRMNDIESRINELNKKFDSVMMEQTMVLKNVEGDTVKQLQLIDGKTRTMLDDIRSQMNQLKANQDTDLSRLETRMNFKIDESQRNTEKFDRLDRKIEEYTQSMNKRFVSFEDEFQKNLNKLSTSIEKLENKVNKGIDDRFNKSSNEHDKLKKELKNGFESVQDSLVALQRVVDGKIRLSEDKLEKEIEKIRKMVVLI